MKKNLFVVSENTNVIASIIKLCSPLCNVVTSGLDIVNILILTSKTPPSIIIVECNNYSEVSEILKKIKEKFSNVKRVLVTSYLEDEYRKEIKDRGLADKIIVKPCSKATLLGLLKTGVCDCTPSVVSKQLIGGIIEAYGVKIPVVFRAFDRICTKIDLVSKYINLDVDFAKEVLGYYFLTITTLDSEIITDILCGSHNKKESNKLLLEQLIKVKEVTALNDPEYDPQPLNIMIYVSKKYNGKGYPQDDVAGNELPYLSRVLRVLLDFHYLIEKGKSIGEAVFVLNKRTGWYDTDILQGLISAHGEEATFYLREVFPLGLQSDMIMAQDLFATIKGRKVLILRTGQILSDKNIDYIHRHAQDILDVTEPILIKESILFDEECDA